MVIGDPVVNKAMTICECSGIFLNIMINEDPVIKEALNAGIAREQAWTRKYYIICIMPSTICECSGNFLNIMVSGDLDVKQALTVGVAREQAWTRKSSTIPE